MKKLLVLVFVAALCLPCYGFTDHNILVYKLTCRFNPWLETGTDICIVGTKQINGYLVLDIDLHDPNNPVLNLNPYMITYGKGGTDNWATAFTLDVSTYELSFSIYDIIEKNGKPTGRQCIYMNIEDDDYHAGLGSFLCRLYGKVGPVDIGFVPKVKKNVPTSMNGPINSWTPPVWKAIGNMTATLNSNYTKLANKNGYSEANIVNIISDDLEEKGYSF
jgi:hypothetical protein